MEKFILVCGCCIEVYYIDRKYVKEAVKDFVELYKIDFDSIDVYIWEDIMNKRSDNVNVMNTILYSMYFVDGESIKEINIH